MRRTALLRLAVIIGVTTCWLDSAGAEPAIWIVQHDSSKVFLFGAGPPARDTEWLSPKIEAAVTSSDSFWRETPDETSRGPNQQMVSLGMDPNNPLSTKLSEADRTQLRSVVAALGIDGAQLEPMRPSLAANMLRGRFLANAGFSPAMNADRVLTDLAKAQGKPIRSEFSTTEAMLRFFGEMPNDLAVDFLRTTLDGFEGPRADTDRELAEWLDGELALQEFVVAELQAEYPGLYEYLGVSRNEAWAARIETMLATPSTTFVVVGVYHLVGPDSIQAKLLRRGIRAQRY